MKAIITVVGKDKPGIIASVSTTLAKNNVNIEDISQTIIQNNFSMFMVIELANCSMSISELSKEFDETRKNLGVEVYLQLEEVFNSIYNV